jgi:hypothetical protein
MLPKKHEYDIEKKLQDKINNDAIINAFTSAMLEKKKFKVIFIICLMRMLFGCIKLSLLETSSYYSYIRASPRD